MIPIRYPNITGKTPEEKLRQMERELRLLVDQLNYALEEIERRMENNQDKGGTFNGNH